MGLSRIGAVRVFDKWALGLCLIPDLPLRRDRAPAAGRSTGAGQNLASVPRGQTGGVLLVGGMNGVVVTLDAALLEVHRFQAHEGAVNVVQYHDQLIWTGGGDGCLRAWSWPDAEEVLCLRGPKQPIVACWHDPVLGVLAQSHERALYRWPLQDGQPAQEPRRIRNISCLQRLPSAWEQGEAEGQGEVGGREKWGGKVLGRGRSSAGSVRRKPAPRPAISERWLPLTRRQGASVRRCLRMAWRPGHWRPTTRRGCWPSASTDGRGSSILWRAFASQSSGTVRAAGRGRSLCPMGVGFFTAMGRSSVEGQYRTPRSRASMARLNGRKAGFCSLGPTDRCGSMLPEMLTPSGKGCGLDLTPLRGFQISPAQSNGQAALHAA